MTESESDVDKIRLVSSLHSIDTLHLSVFKQENVSCFRVQSIRSKVSGQSENLAIQQKQVYTNTVTAM